MSAASDSMKSSAAPVSMMDSMICSWYSWRRTPSPDEVCKSSSMM